MNEGFHMCLLVEGYIGSGKSITVKELLGAIADRFFYHPTSALVGRAMVSFAKHSKVKESKLEFFDGPSLCKSGASLIGPRVTGIV